MKNKHTKGPWFVVNKRTFEDQGGTLHACMNIRQGGAYRGEICGLQSSDHIEGISREETEANARLIAAAPDLLEALTKAAEVLAFITDHNRTITREEGATFTDAAKVAQAAIAKAAQP